MQMEVTNTTLNVQLRTTLMLFKNKLPCKSTLLPEQVRLIPVIKKKKTAIMRRYCKVGIHVKAIFEVLLIATTLNYDVKEKNNRFFSFTLLTPCKNRNLSFCMHIHIDGIHWQDSE